MVGVITEIGIIRLLNICVLQLKRCYFMAHGLSTDIYQPSNLFYERRARDSNPQPLAGYFSSNEAAHQFAYPPNQVDAQRHDLRAECSAIKSLSTCKFCTADQFDELIV